MTTGRARRGGFSLIELMTVIGIIALLSALAVGTYMRLRGSTTEKVTDETMTKIHSMMADRWGAVIDRATADIRSGSVPADVMTAANNDKDLARVIWTYFKLKNEFPTTRAEGTTDIQIKVNGSFKTVLKAKAVFSSIPVNPSSVSATSIAALETESAACLYKALRDTGTGGVVTGVEGLEQQTGTSASGPVYTDAWNTPIAFARMAYTAELNGPPYLKGNPVSKDPIDPLGRLINKPSALPTTFDLASFWNTVWSNHIGTAGSPDWPGSPIPTTYATNTIGTANWVPTLISAGANKRYRTVQFDPPSSPNTPPSWLIGTDELNGDNPLSFRVRAGQKGI